MLRITFRRAAVSALIVAALAAAAPARAHCDTLDGPVVAAARRSLDSGDPLPALAWVQPADDAAIRAALQRAREVRHVGGAAKELADQAFYETLVRVHRAGEGAPYTGLKPAGSVEPAVAAADRAIASGDLRRLADELTQRTKHGLHQRFDAVLATRRDAAQGVDAGRAHVAAYVDFVHHVERLHEASAPAGVGDASKTAPAHAH